MDWETIPIVEKMKILFCDECDRGSCPEYFETFRSPLGVKFIEIEQFEITREKSNIVEKLDQSLESSTELYCACLRVNPRCIVCIGKRNESCII